MSRSDHAGVFKKGDPRTKEAARKGGLVKHAKAAGWFPPYEGTILDVMDEAGLVGATWAAWRALWKAVFALPMSAEDLAIFRRHTGRETPPEDPVDELWMPVGRRGGKTHNAAAAGLFVGISFDASTLSKGETAVVMIIAADRRQARVCLRYLKALAKLPRFSSFVHRELKESIELQSGVVIEVATGSYRTVRGFTVVGVICDEIAFWQSDDASANPDSEILAALRPAMATVPNSLLLGLSSPYAARGELYRAVERSFGQDDPHVLVWNADTASMNPGVPARVIDRAFEDDPVAAASEYGRDGRVQFRRDVEAFLDPEAVQAVVDPGVRERPPNPSTSYVAFVDPSGGSQDSFTLAIAHLGDDDRAVLDVVREVRPPFSPDDVVSDFADTLRRYGVTSVVGDRYAGEWPRERFSVHGIRYLPSDRTKSELYRELVAPVNSRRVVLLDLPVLRAQLVGLERRVARGGRDSIDHARGGRDDVANAAGGALGLLSQRQSGKRARLIA